MPFYDFKNKDTGELLLNQRMSIDQMEKFLVEHPEMQIQLGATPLGDPVRLGLHKTPSSFRDLLKTIKSKHVRSNIRSD